MFKRWFISVIIIGGLFIVLGNSMDWSEVYENLINFPKQSLALFLTISFIISFAKSYRFFSILRGSKINIDFKTAFKTYFAGGATSPLPAGEVLRSSLLKKEENIGIHRSLTPVLMQSYVEVLSAVLIVIAFSLFFELFLVPAILSLLLLVGIYLVLSYDKPLRILIKKFVKRKRIYVLLSRIKQNQGVFRKTFLVKKRIIPNPVFLRPLLISLFTQFLGGVLFYSIANSLGGEISYFQSIFIYSLGIVVSSIGSISPGGLGFTEGAMTAALVFFGVNFSIAIIAVLIFRIVTLIFNVLIGLIFLLIFYKEMILKIH